MWDFLCARISFFKQTKAEVAKTLYLNLTYHVKILFNRPLSSTFQIMHFQIMYFQIMHNVLSYKKSRKRIISQNARERGNVQLYDFINQNDVFLSCGNL